MKDLPNVVVGSLTSPNDRMWSNLCERYSNPRRYCLLVKGYSHGSSTLWRETKRAEMKSNPSEKGTPLTARNIRIYNQ